MTQPNDTPESIDDFDYGSILEELGLAREEGTAMTTPNDPPAGAPIANTCPACPTCYHADDGGGVCKDEWHASAPTTVAVNGETWTKHQHVNYWLDGAPRFAEGVEPTWYWRTARGIESGLRESAMLDRLAELERERDELQHQLADAQATMAELRRYLANIQSCADRNIERGRLIGSDAYLHALHNVQLFCGAALAPAEETPDA